MDSPGLPGPPGGRGDKNKIKNVLGYSWDEQTQSRPPLDAPKFNDSSGSPVGFPWPQGGDYQALVIKKCREADDAAYNDAQRGTRCLCANVQKRREADDKIKIRFS